MTVSGADLELGDGRWSCEFTRCSLNHSHSLAIHSLALRALGFVFRIMCFGFCDFKPAVRGGSPILKPIRYNGFVLPRPKLVIIISSRLRRHIIIDAVGIHRLNSIRHPGRGGASRTQRRLHASRRGASVGRVSAHAFARTKDFRNGAYSKRRDARTHPHRRLGLRVAAEVRLSRADPSSGGHSHRVELRI